MDGRHMVMELLSNVLESHNYIVFGVYTAMEGIRLAGQEIAALILIDLNLPDMDGQDVITDLGQNRCTLDISVLNITANYLAVKRMETAGIGHADYITKPYVAKDLLASIGKRVSGMDSATQVGII